MSGRRFNDNNKKIHLCGEMKHIYMLIDMFVIEYYKVRFDMNNIDTQ